ncbi:MAG: acyl carrier protein [Burkholderiales bacterium]|nr:acyl carrier protein [Burkholderiales bacterium]
MDTTQELSTSVDTVVEQLRALIVQTFELERPAAGIGEGERLFGDGLGLNSLQGIELLVQVEDSFGITIGELDWSIHEQQTLRSLAELVLQRLSER